MADNNTPKIVDGICDVHRYALADTNQRKVYYCTTCNAYICKDCEYNFALRAIAWAVRTASGK